MTAEEQKAAESEIIRFHQENPDYWGDQDENGIDVARLHENLSLTPTQRLRKMDAGRNALHWMRNVRANNPVG